MALTKIYTLEDPDTNVIKYVGKTNRELNLRLNEHIYSTKKKSNKVSSWIKNLLKIGKKPIIKLVDEVDSNEWSFWEMHYVSLFRSFGFTLKNGNNGGGTDNTGFKQTEETKRKISEANKGHICYTLGVVKTDDEKKRLSEKMKGKPSPLKGRPSPLKGRKRSEETVLKSKIMKLIIKLKKEIK